MISYLQKGDYVGGTKPTVTDHFRESVYVRWIPLSPKRRFSIKVNDGKVIVYNIGCQLIYKFDSSLPYDFIIHVLRDQRQRKILPNGLVTACRTSPVPFAVRSMLPTAGPACIAGVPIVFNVCTVFFMKLCDTSSLKRSSKETRDR